MQICVNKKINILYHHKEILFNSYVMDKLLVLIHSIYYNFTQL